MAETGETKEAEAGGMRKTGRCVRNGTAAASRMASVRRLATETARPHVRAAGTNARQLPFISPGGCRYRAILRRSRPVRNCHFAMRARLWFLCKRLQDPIA